MVGIKHAFSIGNGIVDTTFLAPWQANERVNVITHNRGFSRHWRHELELLQLGLSFLKRLFGQLRSLNLLFKLFKIGAVFAFTQLFLNGFNLLVQVVVALAFLHLLLNPATNTLFNLKNVNFRLKLRQKILETLGCIHNIEHLLLLLKLERQMRSNRIGQASRLVDAA